VSHPKKKYGFKTIHVEGDTFRWRFDSGPDDSSLKLSGAVSSGQPLEITLVGWRNPWFAISGFDITEAGRKLVLRTDAHNEPEIVTPKFVRTAILHALAHGWMPNKPGQHLYGRYSDHAFSALSTRLGELPSDASALS
jgi:hypothetical protein